MITLLINQLLFMYNGPSLDQSGTDQRATQLVLPSFRHPELGSKPTMHPVGEERVAMDIG